MEGAAGRGLKRTTTSGATQSKIMSFLDSLRSSPPFRVPRPTIMSESPIYDISSHRSDSPLYPRNRVLGPQLSSRNGNYSFPGHLRTRRLDDIDPDIFSQRNGREVPSSSATYADRLVTDRMPLPMPMSRLEEERDAYFPHARHTPPGRVLNDLQGEQAQADQPIVSPAEQEILNESHGKRFVGPLRRWKFFGNPEIETYQPPAETDGIHDFDIVTTPQSTNLIDKVEIMNARALRSNSFLGYQRFSFVMTKYPVLVMTMVALWNIAGRGEEMHKTGTEKTAYYFALVTATIVLVSQAVLSGNHHGSYKRARIMSYLYHSSMVAAFLASAIVVILAGANVNEYKDNKTETTCKYMNNAPCYSNNERVAYLAVLVGLGLMVIFLAIATFIYGGLGLIQMKQRLVDEYAKDAQRRTYQNFGFQ